MAKLINENETITTSTYVPETKPSLNQLAIVLGIPAVRLQSAQVAYKPIEGKPYNPKEINWENVSAFIARRLDKTDYATVEEVYDAALKVEYTPRVRGNGTTTNKVLFGTTPVRKGDVTVGAHIWSKKTGAEFEVKYVDDTIVVYASVEGEHAISEAIGNRMFNMNFLLEASKATATGDDTAADLFDEDEAE